MAPPRGGVEILKKDPNEFGGIQFSPLYPLEISQRTCAAKFCSWSGAVQVQIPGENPPTFRIWCGPHYIKQIIIAAICVGDPSPFEQAKRTAERMDVDWKLVESLQAKDLSDPRGFACITCGGGMIEETAGMFSGIRFVHTCGH